MPVRPYLLTGDAVLAAAVRALRGAADAWCADWGVAQDAVTIACARAWEAVEPPPGALWRPSRRSGEALWWHASVAEWSGQVQRALFPHSRDEAVPLPPASLAAAAAEAACQDLLDSLSGTAQCGMTAPPPAREWLHGSGALCVLVRIGKHAMILILNHAAAAELARRGGAADAPQAALPALDYGQALRDVALSLPLEIGRAEVGLGSLMMLGVGDVIRLDTLADRPLTVNGPGGGALFDAYMGLAGPTVALEIVRRD